MTFSVDLGTLFAGAGIFLLVVFVKPLVLIARDKVVWWWIEKWMLTSGFYSEIDEYAKEHYLQKSGVRPFTFMFLVLDQAEPAYELIPTVDMELSHPIRLSGDERKLLEEQNKKCTQRYRVMKAKIAKRSATFDMLMRHYDQLKPNLIDEQVSSVLEQYDEGNSRYMNPIDRLEYVVSEIMSDPASWRSCRGMERFAGA